MPRFINADSYKHQNVLCALESALRMSQTPTPPNRDAQSEQLEFDFSTPPERTVTPTPAAPQQLPRAA